MFKLRYFFIYIHIISSAFAQTQNESCETPDKKIGNCVEIRKCNYLLNLLKNKSRTKEQTDFLKSSQCNVDHLNHTYPIVCCPPLQNLLPTKEECGLSTEATLLGGTDTLFDEYPWMALLEYELKNRTDFLCGGVLISKRYVLTAAHCVTYEYSASWKLNAVRLGEHTISKNLDCTEINGETNCADPPISFPIEEVIIHEKYKSADPHQYNDIALIRLNRDVPITDFISPICLPFTEEEVNKKYVSHRLTVSGWGKTENNSLSDSKLKLLVTVWNNTDCARRYLESEIKVVDTQLCAGGEEGEDSCNGDSGGPLMSHSTFNEDINWYVVGIVSFGPRNCGLKGWPGVYTRVSKYSEWIVRNMHA